MKRKAWLLLVFAIALAFLLSILAVCGPKENCTESRDPRQIPTLRICTDKRIYDFGAPIYITFTVTNISHKPLVLDGGEKSALDIRVKGEYWSDEREPAAELTRVRLEPGESHTITWVWPTPQTDLMRLLKRRHSPEVWELLGIRVYGILRPRPGIEREMKVIAEYRWP